MSSKLTAKERHSCTAGMTQIEHVDFTKHLRDGELLTGTPTVSVETGSGEVTVSSPQVNTATIELKGVESPRTAAVGEVATFKAVYASTITVSNFVFKVAVDTYTNASNPYRTLVGYLVVPVESAPTE